MEEKTLDTFLKLNPFDFSKEQMERLIKDIENPRKGILSDEKVDFLLWCEYGLSRQDYFMKFFTTLFKKEKYLNVLEVGCGYNAKLSKLLSMQGYKMTALDPNVKIDSSYSSITFRKEFFDYTMDISKYDVLLAEEPCDATEHIIKACIKEKKDFIIELCATPHNLLNGRIPEDCNEWYSYLESLDSEHTFILRNIPVIPNINSNIMIGIFNNENNSQE